LPQFLRCGQDGSINGLSSVAFGFAIGIAGQRPDPVQHPKLHASASINGVPAIMRDH
jgi:hypothetical protein